MVYNYRLNQLKVLLSYRVDYDVKYKVRGARRIDGIKLLGPRNAPNTGYLLLINEKIYFN